MPIDTAAPSDALGPVCWPRELPSPGLGWPPPILAVALMPRLAMPKSGSGE